MPSGLLARWSARSEVIDRQAARFRSRYGREPSARELDAVTVRTRGSKTLLEQVDVDGAWRAVAEEYGLSRDRAEGLFADRPRERDGRDVGGELLGVLGRERSMVSRRELDARAYEVAAGAMAPAQAQNVVDALIASGELIELEGSTFTTRELRELAQRTVGIAAARRDEPAASVSPESLVAARRSALRELRSGLSVEQREALDTLTGPGGVSVLVGQAGRGRAWCSAPRRRRGGRRAMTCGAPRSPARPQDGWARTPGSSNRRPPTHCFTASTLAL